MAKIQVEEIRLAPLAPIDEIAKIAHMSPRSIRYLCEKGQIRCVKVGRVWRINSQAALRQFGLID